VGEKLCPLQSLAYGHFLEIKERNKCIIRRVFMLNDEFSDVLKTNLANALQIKNDGALERESARGHLEKVRELLGKGADLHAWDDGALRAAALNGHLKVVSALLGAGANPAARDREAIRWAGENGHDDLMWLLLNALDAPSTLINF
jgi:ankyrin repeat protein